MNRFTPTLLFQMCCLVFILTQITCAHSDAKSFILVDQRKAKHDYNEFPILYHLDKKTLYCKKHFQFEDIQALYNSNKNDYDYVVSKSRRQL